MDAYTLGSHFTVADRLRPSVFAEHLHTSLRFV